MDKKTFKEALKGEISPLLIGLRNEIIETNKTLVDMQKSGTHVNHLHFTVAGKELPEMVMRDGKTPQRGTDYFTEKDIKSFLKAVTPIKGFDYFTEEDVKSILKFATPKKGKDYFDGKDGKTPKKGKDYFTKAEIKEFLDAVTPIKGIHYKDGKDGKVIKKDVAVSQLSAEDIRAKLESLKGKAKLKISAVGGLQELLDALIARLGMPVGGPSSSSGNSGGGSSSAGSIISATNSGDNKNYNLAKAATTTSYYVMINGGSYSTDDTQFPFSVSGTVLTFTSALPPDTANTLIKLICV